MINRDKVKRSLQLKWLISRDGEYREEISSLLGVVEARVHKQMAEYDRKMRSVINQVLLRADEPNIGEAELFSFAERACEAEFEGWTDQNLSGIEKGIREILLDWRSR